MSNIFKSTVAVVKNPAAIFKNPKIGHLALKVKDVSPTVAVYAGVTGLVGAGVLACTKSFETHHVHSMELAERSRMKARAQEDEQLAKTLGKDLTQSYLREGVKLARIYGPSLSLAAASVASILWGHHTLSKRHAALVGAFGALNATFQDYRERMVEALGEEAEAEIREGLVRDFRNEQIGQEKAEAELKDTLHVENGLSIYARLFDETNVNWERDATLNLSFLRIQQNHLNDMLMTRGYVFLNEVYKSLGFPATKVGQVVGWRSDSKHGDRFIDFGIYDEENPNAQDFVNGFEKSVMLDFNVDGYILNDAFEWDQ